MHSSLLLTLFSGIAWTIVYVDSITLGFKNKTYAMPFWALVLNISWEFLYVFLGLKDVPVSVQDIVNIVWFLPDCCNIIYLF
jgi:hypothetical protein